LVILHKFSPDPF